MQRIVPILKIPECLVTIKCYWRNLPLIPIPSKLFISIILPSNDPCRGNLPIRKTIVRRHDEMIGLAWDGDKGLAYSLLANRQNLITAHLCSGVLGLRIRYKRRNARTRR